MSYYIIFLGEMQEKTAWILVSDAVFFRCLINKDKGKKSLKNFLVLNKSQKN